MELYRAFIGVGFEGLNVYFQRWTVVRETPHMYWCVQSSLTWEGRTFDGVKGLKRVHKVGSRFAFPTKDEAYSNLIFRKRSHIQHLKNRIKEVETFLGAVDSGYSPQLDGGDFTVVPNTDKFVQQNYFFN